MKIIIKKILDYITGKHKAKKVILEARDAFKRGDWEALRNTLSITTSWVGSNYDYFAEEHNYMDIILKEHDGNIYELQIICLVFIYKFSNSLKYKEIYQKFRDLYMKYSFDSEKYENEDPCGYAFTKKKLNQIINEIKIK